MNATYRPVWLALAFLLSIGNLTAQFSITEDIQRADKQFNLYAYNLALRSYEQVLKTDPNNPYVLARLGDCYFQLNRPEEALTWYDRAVSRRSADSEVFLRYGKALMYTGNYKEAKNWFERYSETDPTVGRHFASMCDYAADASRKEPLYAVRAEPMNSTAADYLPAFFGNRLVFSSARTDIKRKKDNKSASDWSGSANNQLFLTQRTGDAGSLESPSFLKSDLQNTYNEGPVSFSSDGKRVAFCRNNFIDGTRQIAEKGINMSLYTADVVDGNWINVKAFPFNGSDYATGFPGLSPNGKTLVFSSNQPGGLGGWDLYVSNWTKDGTWSTPRNLGTPINTRGNEVAPFYDGKDLFFSSDWHRGLGGLDVFRAELGSETGGNVFHLGPGINSPRDDYGFVYNANQRIGYVTSNRTEGRGHEDIWQVTKRFEDTRTALSEIPAPTTRPGSERVEDKPIQYGYEQPRTTETRRDTRYLQIVDENDNPLPYAEIEATECGYGAMRTDEFGMFYFIPPGTDVNCTLKVSKSGYRTANIAFKSFGRENVTIALQPETAKVKMDTYTGTVIDASSGALVSGATVEVDITGNGRPTVVTTDRNGSYSLRLDAYETYDVFYGKNGYLQTIVKTNPALYSSDRKLPPVILERMNYTGTADAPAQYSTPSKKVSSNQPSVYLPAQYTTPSQPAVAEKEKITGYAIQLAASTEEMRTNELKKYEELTKLGNLYSKEEGKLIKIRLGIYTKKEEAQKVLNDIQKDKKYKEAFVVEERGADASLAVGANPLKPAEYGPSKATKGSTPASSIRYAVQLGSFAPDRSISISDYTRITDLGNIYSKTENGLQKVRLGVWTEHSDAEDARDKAVARGFKDAIVVTEKAEDESIKAFVLPEEAPRPVQHTTTTPPTKNKAAAKIDPSKNEYLVRLMTVSNTAKFDASQVDDLGAVEKRKADNGMTIVLVGRYPDVETANEIQNELRNRGFDQCYVVREEKGKLNRIK